MAKKRSLWRRILRGAVVTVALLMTLSILLPVSMAWWNPPTWAWRVQRAINPPEHYPQQVQQQWVSLDRIAADMQLAIVAAEDQLFFQHSGFDLNSIRQARAQAAAGGRVRGASTLSQQTSKNLFLTPHRSMLRKGLEAWLTFWLELACSKARILELYANIVEFGPGIYGVEAAAQHYFQRPASDLTARQSAQLAAVLPNPYRFSVTQPSQHTQNRVRWIERQMRQLGPSHIPRNRP